MSDCRLNSSSLWVTGCSGSGLLTYTPLPVRISTQPVISSAISASRIDDRLTPNCLERSLSEGIIAPGANCPVLMQLIRTLEIWRYSRSTFSVGNSIVLSALVLNPRSVIAITLMIGLMLNHIAVWWPDQQTTRPCRVLRLNLSAVMRQLYW